MGKDKRKPLVELESPGGKIKMYWPSGQEAANFYGISQVLISLCLKGRAKHAKKKYFRYATEQEIQSYRDVTQRIERTSQPVEETTKATEEPPNITVETIPETVERPGDSLTPFDRLLQKAKEKFN